ncbi:hypothetical protein TYRP_006001 [Tyrophagus putrescentiae]|nr:hypothetical protein TYRP_006001 [Tyrophagus putrescentiae]
MHSMRVSEEAARPSICRISSPSRRTPNSRPIAFEAGELSVMLCTKDASNGLGAVGAAVKAQRHAETLSRQTVDGHLLFDLPSGGSDGSSLGSARRARMMPDAGMDAVVAYRRCQQCRPCPLPLMAMTPAPHLRMTVIR